MAHERFAKRKLESLVGDYGGQWWAIGVFGGWSGNGAHVGFDFAYVRLKGLGC
jgi:hypothetical protein